MQKDYGAVPSSSSGECTPINSNGHNNNTSIDNQEHNHELHRHLTLFDLVCVGVGSTIGSGVFVLVGLIGRLKINTISIHSILLDTIANKGHPCIV